MSPNRVSRQSAILEVLRSRPVQTQEELAQELRRRRIPATQATISRDLRQLQVARVPVAGGTRYLPPAEPGNGESHLAVTLAAQLASLEVVGVFVVLRTQAGGAQVVAAAIDALGREPLAGTVAGDDTVFALCRSIGAARALAGQLEEARQRGLRWR
ncbi:MAG: arginine repressor [Candidatus Dormibacteria bacterium]